VPAALCPKCRWPLSREESRSGKCPFCAAALDADPAAASRAAALPPPVDERSASVPPSQAMKPFVRGALILLMLAVGGGGLYYAVSTAVTRYLGGTDAQPQAASPEADKRHGAPPAAEAPGGAAPAAVPASPEAKGESPPAPPAPHEATSEPLPAASQEIVVVGKVRKIDNPEGEYVVEPLDGAAQVVLRGEVKTLRIGRLDGNAILEALNLQAREVIFTGAVDGNARARVHAPNGSVEVRASVGGRANLTIDATGGRVTFPVPAAGGARARIDGDSRMVIKAREIDFQVPINGGAQVSAVLSAGAKIRFTELKSSSRLTWRKADARDPDPVIGRGVVSDDARFRENK